MRFLKRSALLTALALAAVLVSGYVTLRASLPQLDGALRVDRIRASVTIERDAGGIPVITAHNRGDLAFATGFVHGQDRFFQMDLSRRRAAGELAELFGPAAVPLDKRNRMHRFRNRARAVLAGLDPADSDVVTAYAAGVNAGLESLGARPFEYLLLRAKPRPWHPEDSLLVAYNMFLELNDERADRDRRRGIAHEALPRAVFEFIYPDGTSWDAPLNGEPRATRPPPESADTAMLDMRRSVPDTGPMKLDEAIMAGSNSWAVGGALSHSGRAIVANDMHLGLTVPNVFYRARLIVRGETDLDLNGVTLPGVPLLVAGSNGSIAWANTNSYGDWSDAVVIRSGDVAGSYLTPNGQRKFTTYAETIFVKGHDPQEIIIRETVWGPVLDDQSGFESQDLLAVSWLAHKPEAVNLYGLRLETAKSAEEALDIANRIGMPPQNFVVGDASGNIGWTIAGRIPLRAGFDPQLPADWSRGGGWTGWLAAERYPRILNPESGRIWTANARVVDGEALSAIGDGGYDLGARARQIRDGLFDRDRFRAADMLAIQLDDRAVFLRRWQQLLLTILDGDAMRNSPEREEYRGLVADWGERAAADSAGYRLVRDFRDRVRKRVFEMLVRPVRERYGSDAELRISNQFEAPLWSMIQHEPDHLLAPEYASWRALLVAAIDDSLNHFREEYGGSLSRRTWGERNSVEIHHPLGRAVPALARWIDMPRIALPGDANMPRVQQPSFGASERFAVAPGAEADGFMHMPGGQSGHPLSAFYSHGHLDWVEGRRTAFLPGDAAYRLTLEPLSSP